VLLKLNQAEEYCLGQAHLYQGRGVLPIYIKHTLETPKVVLLGLILAERE
jgi:hypothetical protein